MMLSNPALVQHGQLRVDRKCHVGLLTYTSSIAQPFTAVHPKLRDGQTIMDAIEIPLSELPYAVKVFETDASYQLLPSELARMREQIAASSLVYGSGMSSERMARELRIPYILVREYDLQTQLTITNAEVSSRVRRAVKGARCVTRYFADCFLNVRTAHAIHCNGYPIYEALRPYNKERLLFLDSRMSADMIMPRQMLTERLEQRSGRALRLLYSGRYERLKGADDAVKVAVECLRLGLNIEMHCYGQGSLRARMDEIAREFADRIHIHDAVPYPELVRLSRSFDIFVCCHIQSDPSCTYLESFGAGLPIVGYDNRMWKGLCTASAAGLASALHQPHQVARDVQRLAADEQLLRTLSERALQFATEHCFEAEFKRRIDHMQATLDGSGRQKVPAPSRAAAT